MTGSSIAQAHGFVFQSFNLISHQHQKISKSMFYRYVEHASYVRRKSLPSLSVWATASHRPSELSGGQQQRVAIARSLANDPLIILADEPTGNLDSQSGRDILNILDMLYQQGKTLIVITHDEDIAKHSQREIRLFDGRIDKQWYNR
jgi:putative ABC transport system ATP-binding protein